MKAAQFYGKKDIRIRDVEVPQAKDDEALIAVEWCGICGTDLHEYLVGPQNIPIEGHPHPLTNDTLPVTLGHEFCGRVLQAPANSKLEVGQSVVVDPRLYCVSCPRCMKSQTNTCLKWGFLGFSGGGGGGFSETVAVKESMCYALRNPEDLEFAALVEPLAVAWRAVKSAAIDSFLGRAVLILGGGPIGIALILVLRARSADQIYVSEPTTKRRAQNEELADAVFDPIQEKVGDRCRALTGGKGVEFVFDAAGIPAGCYDGFDSLAHQGTYINVAGWESPFTVPFGLFMFKEVTIKPSFAYDDVDFSETMEAFNEGKFKGLEQMVTSRIRLEDILEKGYKELIENKDEHIKILVSPKAD
ncbi:threonine dehydrogenase [Patellaria atrata CBS 101060]|uniref:Threonine dehydrogenase n=1 Tax=Patellaria atrata CBS 101060 TaxID=1346257 RepID=A0A9P4S399_9PEZI|nr:threonine dehydrogenase [Patellaria atrata CBS 101060]